MLEISWLAQQLLASQEGLCSMELVSNVSMPHPYLNTLINICWRVQFMKFLIIHFCVSFLLLPAVSDVQMFSSAVQFGYGGCSCHSVHCPERNREGPVKISDYRNRCIALGNKSSQKCLFYLPLSRWDSNGIHLPFQESWKFFCFLLCVDFKFKSPFREEERLYLQRDYRLESNFLLIRYKVEELQMKVKVRSFGLFSNCHNSRIYLWRCL